MTRRLESSYSPRVSGENSMRSSFQNASGSPSVTAARVQLFRLWLSSYPGLLAQPRTVPSLPLLALPLLGSRTRASLAPRIDDAIVGVIASDRTPNTHRLGRRTELALVGYGKIRAAVHGVGSLKIRGEDDVEVTGRRVSVAGSGLLTPAVLRERAARCSSRTE